MKRLSAKKNAAVRDLLSSCIADYNKTTPYKAFKIKEDLKRVIYGVLRCPSELLDLMKLAGDLYKWEHGGQKNV